jgi:catechol 2,3-dioxygenase-like lactoylglutathione lyase family enzyme
VIFRSSLDHVVIAVSDFELSNRFYAEVLGAEIIELRRGRYAYRFGEQQLNVHSPDSTRRWRDRGRRNRRAPARATSASPGRAASTKRSQGLKSTA